MLDPVFLGDLAAERIFTFIYAESCILGPLDLSATCVREFQRELRFTGSVVLGGELAVGSLRCSDGVRREVANEEDYEQSR